MTQMLSPIVIESTLPREIIPTLIEHLRSFGGRGQTKAAWITDVYSEVLKGLDQNNLSDTTWVDDLLDTCCKQLNALAQIEPRLAGQRFGEITLGRWGWQEVADA